MLKPYPGYLWHGRTELTGVPGTSMNVVQNSQKFFVRVWMLYRTHRSAGYGYYPGKYTPSGGGVRLEVEDFIQLVWHVLTGPTSPRQSVAVWALSTITTTESNLNEWQPGQQPRSRLQIIAQRTPAVAPGKKPWRSQAQSCHQLDRPSATRTKRSDRKHKG